jgi:hypothetical protein
MRILLANPPVEPGRGETESPNQPAAGLSTNVRLMRTLFAVLLVLFQLRCLADWAVVPTAKLIEQSDIVIIGTLDRVKEWSSKGTDYGQGDITVAEVLWTKTKADAKLRLVWQNGSTLACPRVEHRGDAKQKGIWLLTRGEKGEVRADYPGRFVPLEQKAEILKLLAARKKKT